MMGVDDPVLGDPRPASAKAVVDASVVTAVPDADPPPCTANPDNCGIGSYCAADGHCTPGCKADAECAQLSTAAPLCNVMLHQCVTCLRDDQCTNGLRCSPSGACVSACSSDGGTCAAGRLCCGGLCIDPKADVLNCGKCDFACSTLNAAPTCDKGTCQWKCAAGFGHCGTGNTGCDTDIAHDGNNCGQCGHQCTGFMAVEACVAGHCDVTACTPYFGDCNNKPEDGCECACGSTTAPVNHCCPGKICYSGQCDNDNICRD